MQKETLLTHSLHIKKANRTTARLMSSPKSIPACSKEDSKGFLYQSRDFSILSVSACEACLGLAGHKPIYSLSVLQGWTSPGT